MSNIWVAEECEKPDFGFRVEMNFSPVPDAKERLKRAFSLVLGASKKANESDLPGVAEAQEFVIPTTAKSED